MYKIDGLELNGTELAIYLTYGDVETNPYKENDQDKRANYYSVLFALNELNEQE